jgi:hypothetical protein
MQQGESFMIDGNQIELQISSTAHKILTLKTCSSILGALVSGNKTNPAPQMEVVALSFRIVCFQGTKTHSTHQVVHKR